VRVGSARSADYLQIFAIDVFVRRCSWLSFVSFDLFLRSVFRQVPVSSTRWFGDNGLQACVVWGVAPADVLSAIARSRCKYWVVFAVFKAMCGDDVCNCPLSVVDFQVHFKLRWTTDFGKKKTTKVFINVILFSLRRYVSRCSYLVLPIIFLIRIKYEYTLLVSLSKKVLPHPFLFHFPTTHVS
jgi:hypothetical protein